LLDLGLHIQFGVELTADGFFVRIGSLMRGGPRIIDQTLLLMLSSSRLSIVVFLVSLAARIDGSKCLCLLLRGAFEDEQEAS